MNFHNTIETRPKLILILCMLLFLVFNLFSIQKPFLLDDASFVNAADAINKNGVPIFYEGEVEKEKIGLWHPPLYIYLLAASFWVFGVSEVSARLIGILFSSGTIILIYLLSLEIFKDNQNKHLIALAGAFVYSINPFVIQSAILIDIDTSILTFLTVLFIFVFIKTMQMRYIKRLLILGILFGVLIWAKFGSPIFIILSLAAFYIINKEYKKGILDTSIIVLFGAAFFLLSWSIYTNLTQLPFLLPFQHNMTTGSFSERGVRLLLKVMWGVKNISFWTTPPFILLVFVIFLERIRNFIKTKKLIYMDILLLCGMVIFIAYSIIRTNAYGFPKYYAPSIPVFSILIGEFIARSEPFEIFKHRYIPLIIGFLVISIYFIFVVGDPMLFPYKQEYEILIYKNAFTHFITLSIYKTIIYLLPVLLFFIILNIRTSATRSKMIAVSLIFALISTSIYVDGIQSQAKYSTTYNYGETGLREAAFYVKERTNSNDTIIGETDIGYYSERPYYRAFFLSSSPNQMQEVINSNNLPYLVFRSNDIWKNEVKDVIASKYSLEDKIGSFVIYKKA